MCVRYGHQAVAAALLRRLRGEAASEAAQRWLSALHRAADADARLQAEGAHRFRSWHIAASPLHRVISSARSAGVAGLEACSGAWEACGEAGGAAGAGAGACAAGCAGCGACTPLAAAWMSARAAALGALAAAAAAARALCTQPPPAVAQAAREASGRAGAAAGALRRAARLAAAAAQRYHHIARTAFHADRSTLRHLHM